MQLKKRFLDLSPWVLDAPLPEGKTIGDVEEIFLILKERPEHHVNLAKINKKRTDGDILWSNDKATIILEAIDFNGMRVGYNYIGGLIFTFTGEPGFNEDNGDFDVTFDYPIYFTGEELGDQIQDPETLLDIYLQMIKVETYTADPGGQSVFYASDGVIKDNVLLAVQVGGEFWNPKNGVKGFAGGNYTVNFQTGTITFDEPLFAGTQVIITYS